MHKKVLILLLTLMTLCFSQLPKNTYDSLPEKYFTEMIDVVVNKIEKAGSIKNLNLIETEDNKREYTISFLNKFDIKVLTPLQYEQGHICLFINDGKSISSNFFYPYKQYDKDSKLDKKCRLLYDFVKHNYKYANFFNHYLPKHKGKIKETFLSPLSNEYLTFKFNTLITNICYNDNLIPYVEKNKNTWYLYYNDSFISLEYIPGTHYYILNSQMTKDINLKDHKCFTDSELGKTLRFVYNLFDYKTASPIMQNKEQALKMGLKILKQIKQ